MKKSIFLSVALAATGILNHAVAADAVFSGPQPGEKTTPFKVLEVRGPNQGKERDPITENAGAPTALVFIHTVERSLVPLLKAVDQYGFEQKDKLKSEVVFLNGDRIEGEQRTKTVANAIQLMSRVGLSIDGAEGPGNYGLNKECMMTIVIAKDNKVTANFALVQPGIADAPKVIAALAKVCGDTNPPTAEQLSERAMAAAGGGRPRPGAMQRDGAQTTGKAESAAAGPGALPPTKKLPGAAPTDPQLLGLLRSFIQPTNDDAKVDKVLEDVRKYLKEKPELTKQAIDGWVRVLAIPYGTPYAQKAGQQFLDKLKAPEPNK